MLTSLQPLNWKLSSWSYAVSNSARLSSSKLKWKRDHECVVFYKFHILGTEFEMAIDSNLFCCTSLSLANSEMDSINCKAFFALSTLTLCCAAFFSKKNIGILIQTLGSWVQKQKCYYPLSYAAPPPDSNPFLLHFLLKSKVHILANYIKSSFRYYLSAAQTLTSFPQLEKFRRVYESYYLLQTFYFL